MKHPFIILFALLLSLISLCDPIIAQVIEPTKGEEPPKTILNQKEKDTAVKEPKVTPENVITPEGTSPIITPPQASPDNPPTTEPQKIQGPALEEIYLLGVDTHLTFYGGPCITYISGSVRFASVFGGAAGDKLDFENDLFFDTEPMGFRVGIDLQHERFHLSIDYSFTENSGEGNIDREITVSDTKLVSGSQIKTDWDLHTFRINLGYTFYRSSWLGVGVEVPIGFVFSRMSGSLKGYPHDPTVSSPVTISLRYDLFVPLPRMGFYVDVSPWDRFVARFHTYVIYYDIARKRATNYGFAASARYYFTLNFYLFAGFEYQFLGISYKDINCNGDTISFTGGAGIHF